MAGFEHFTETFSNYNFHYYSIPEQPYAWFSNGQTTNHYFLQLMYQLHNMVLPTVYLLQNYPNLTVICRRYIIYNQSNHTSLKPLKSNNKFYASCSTLWSVDAQQFLLAHISQNKAIVVTMAIECNSHQQCSTPLLWSIPFPVKNIWLFLARTIKLASSAYCHTFKIQPRIQYRL
jgi:hypothetical protein